MQTSIETNTTIPDNVLNDFNESLRLTECFYKEHLLSIEEGQLIKVGPLSKQDALSFFNQYYKNTFPLYMLQIDNEYYAYY